jgi:signal transduction histidine kinase/ligand-binding sensor domain-containing protein
MKFRDTKLFIRNLLDRIIQLILVLSIFPVGISITFVQSQDQVIPNSDTLQRNSGPKPVVDNPSDSSIDQFERWNPRFEHFSIPEGLPSSSIRSITQDSTGFMWIGTLNGLSRFDGYEFINYQLDPENPEVNPFIEVNAVYTDRDGDLWVGTQSGLSFYDDDTREFVHYQHDPDNPDSVGPGGVIVILEDSQGIIWAGTNYGLDKFDRESQTFTNYQFYSRTPVIYEDSNKILWYGTNVGLFKLDPATKILTNYKNQPEDQNSLSDNTISSIIEDSYGDLWIGTSNGLNRFDNETENFTHYFHDPDIPQSLSNNLVTKLLLDRSGRIWVATLDGLNIFNPDEDIFYHIEHDPSNQESLSDDLVADLFEDQSGVIWIGTITGGLNKYSESYNRFHLFPQDLLQISHQESNPDESNPSGNQESLLDSLSGALITDIYENEDGDFWLGTFFQGLYKIDGDSGDYMHYFHDPDDVNSLSDDVINYIEPGLGGELWIATNAGLDRLDLNTNTFESIPRFENKSVNSILLGFQGDMWVGARDGLYRLFRDEDNELTSEFQIIATDKPYNPGVRTLFEDKTGSLWVVTYNDGVYVRSPGEEQFINYAHDPDDPESLSGFSVFSIYQDASDEIWLGTFLGGLSHFNQETGVFTHYSSEDGLAGDWVSCIQSDDDGYLWLGTNYGLSKFDPHQEVFNNYDSSDGLQSGEFYGCGQSKSGEMFFGGLAGLNTFYPQDIKENKLSPPVVITKLNLFNEPERLDLDPDEYIQLPYNENFISFDYAALDFNSPEKNQYAYMLDGLDQDWIYAGSRRHAEYPDLEPGEYTFWVKASNNDGVWNEEGASARIVIKPPFWQEFWFRALMTITIVGVIIIGYQLNVRRIRARSRELETQVKERTLELEERTTESERRQAELEALYRADEELYRYLHLEHVLHALVEVAVDILRADKGTLFVWDDDHEKLIVQTAIGYSRGTKDRMEFHLGQGAVGEVAETGEPVLIERTIQDPRTADTIIISEGVQSTIQVPIMLGEDVFGVFTTDYTQRHTFTDRELRLLIALAQRAALSIENARLYEQAQHLAAVEERNRLARDLHDSVTQSLFGASMFADTAQNQLDSGQIEEAADSLNKLRTTTRVALGEMRLLIYELRPPVLEEEGLVTALEARLETVEQRAGLNTELIINDVDRLPDDVEQQFYSIAIEALNNALKHANAERIIVELTRDAAVIQMNIIDDGIGFDVQSGMDSGGFGLISIQERARELGANLKIESKTGSGTSVKIVLELT